MEKENAEFSVLIDSAEKISEINDISEENATNEGMTDISGADVITIDSTVPNPPSEQDFEEKTIKIVAKEGPTEISRENESENQPALEGTNFLISPAPLSDFERFTPLEKNRIPVRYGTSPNPKEEDIELQQPREIVVPNQSSPNNKDLYRLSKIEDFRDADDAIIVRGSHVG
jgi:hypothetical protein